MTDKCFYEEQRVTQRWVQILLWVIWVGLASAAVVALVTKKTGLPGAVALVAPITACVFVQIPKAAGQDRHSRYKLPVFPGAAAIQKNQESSY